MKKIENIIKVYIVVRRKDKYVKPDTIPLPDFHCNVLAVFPNRRQAQKYIDYWDYEMNNKNGGFYDILERKLK